MRHNRSWDPRILWYAYLPSTLILSYNLPPPNSDGRLSGGRQVLDSRGEEIRDMEEK